MGPPNTEEEFKVGGYMGKKMKEHGLSCEQRDIIGDIIGNEIRSVNIKGVTDNNFPSYDITTLYGPEIIKTSNPPNERAKNSLWLCISFEYEDTKIPTEKFKNSILTALEKLKLFDVLVYGLLNPKEDCDDEGPFLTIICRINLCKLQHREFPYELNRKNGVVKFARSGHGIIWHGVHNAV